MREAAQKPVRRRGEIYEDALCADGVREDLLGELLLRGVVESARGIMQDHGHGTVRTGGRSPGAHETGTKFAAAEVEREMGLRGGVHQEDRFVECA